MGAALMLSSGLKAWVTQRLTALYLGVYILGFVGYLWVAPPASYLDWLNWLQQPTMQIAMVLFFLSLVLHVWVGVRDILMDYVHGLVWRSVLLTMILLFLIVMMFWSIKVILQIGH